MADFEFSARVSTQEVVLALTYLTHEDLVEFLAELDDTIGDWDFTAMARDYFVSEMKKVEEPDDVG